jgi:3-deoxy-D-manno-octulosonic-acid transferase
LPVFLYNIFLWLYRTSIRIAALWNPKAGLWVNGRKNIFSHIHSKLNNNNAEIIWIHCSSLGEFEQGRPVMEKMRSLNPKAKLLLTFFSPSGYEVRKDYAGADWIFYLPMDSAGNAKKFLEFVKPSLVVFVKYDYWYYYITECKKRNIPLLMISSIFRKEQSFFKWHGSLHRKMLECFTHFFVQDENSKLLLASLQINNVTVAGDTRFDRVAEIARNFKPVEGIEKFSHNSPLLVAGSTWPVDEKLIKQATAEIPDLKILIAPHEIHKEHINELELLFPGALRYSQLSNNDSQLSACRYLIIDNIGMLSRLYHYATISFVGGGFSKGIHNTLEAAVHGKPVIFGPNYKKFKEAQGLIESGGGISINNAAALSSLLKRLLSEKDDLENRSRQSADFVKENKGATDKIIGYIQENRLLTN